MPAANGRVCIGTRTACHHYAQKGASQIHWHQKIEVHTAKSFRHAILIPQASQIKNGKLPESVNTMTNLECLELPLPMLNDMNNLGSLPKLRTLVIGNEFGFLKYKGEDCLHDANNLKAINALIVSNSAGCDEMSDFAGIERLEMKELRYLDFRLDKEGKILPKLRHFTSLLHIEIENAGNHNIASYLPESLEAISIHITEKKFPVNELTRFKNLKNLRISGAQCTIDCDIFKHFPLLEELQLSGNTLVKNTEMLAECDKIGYIRFEDTKRNVINKLCRGYGKIVMLPALGNANGYNPDRQIDPPRAVTS